MRDFKVYYGIPTYSQFDYTREAIKAVLSSSLIPDQIVVIDNSENGSGVLALQDITTDRIHVIPRTTNILSGAWNDIMNLFTQDYIILANDDVMPHKYSIEALVTAAREHPEYAIVNGSGHSGNSYSFFLLKKKAYELVGRFDENFKPAYFEDNDYDYRLMKLAGLIRETVNDATFDHVISATVRAMNQQQLEQHHMRFLANERYYRKKWGNVPSREIYREPFGTIIDE